MKIIMIFTTSIRATTLPITISSCTTAPTTQSAIRAYPLDTCIVADKKLGSMGDPVTKLYKEQEVKLYCAPCVKKFEKDSEKYLAKVR